MRLNFTKKKLAIDERAIYNNKKLIKLWFVEENGASKKRGKIEKLSL